MQSISVLMQEERPDSDGAFVSHRYDLKQSGEIVGYLDISYYSPYYMNENDFRFIAALNRILMAVGGVSLIGAVIMGILLANSIAKPISRVVEITQKISEGDYDARFRDGIRTEELHGLVNAVNQMAESLEEQEILRKRLTSDVTHELRTPVANISSYMEAYLLQMELRVASMLPAAKPAFLSRADIRFRQPLWRLPLPPKTSTEAPFSRSASN